MSGHKKALVSISQEEYDRLRTASVRVYDLAAQLDDLHEAMRRQTVQSSQDQLREALSRQHAYEETVAVLSENLQDLENASAQAYESLYQAWSQNLSSFEQNWSQQTAEQIESWAHQIFSDIQEEHRARQVELLHLHRNMEEHQHSARQHQALAEQWSESALILLDFIQNHYPPPLLGRVKVQRILEELAAAEGNYNAAAFQAALSAFQRVFFQLSDFRIELERRLARWNHLYQQAVFQVNTHLAVLQRSARVPAVDLEGQEIEDQVDINVWTQGGYAELVQRSQALVSQLESGMEHNPTRTLQQILTHDLPAMREEFTDLVHQARIAVLSSQLRINIADLVVRSLEAERFVFYEGHYDAEDMRRAYSASLKNFAGEEVVIQVHPRAANSLENDLHIISLDRSQSTEHDFRQRFLGIQSSLTDSGLIVEQPREVRLASNGLGRTRLSKPLPANRPLAHP
ncbi:hypothetical protein [Levilinea saccharolytica]|uniref:Uncharacterized protein n=1 Tax=Levilinea saccharolytica TaxID=229921 RepID=A0A0M8JPS2_9CHLR|nr:hypothetical protein [Levilinea saccharolytica]KPL91531.1 hypothetical protein ADN01_00975 [Levilinea saccharolytica]GAP19149.1 hypothetical protein LSAC_03048 [Levilinea saccharolytica]